MLFLSKKSFFIMFDPHRTRRNDRRYYTRKGQVIQASRVDVNPIIDQRLVPIYKNYIIKNGILKSDAPPSPSPSNIIDGIIFKNSSNDNRYLSFPNFDLSYATTVTISGSSTDSPAYVFIFNIDLSGNFHIQINFYQSSTAYNITINDNAICLYEKIGTDYFGQFQFTKYSLVNSSFFEYLSFDLQNGTQKCDISKLFNLTFGI